MKRGQRTDDGGQRIEEIGQKSDELIEAIYR